MKLDGDSDPRTDWPIMQLMVSLMGVNMGVIGDREKDESCKGTDSSVQEVGAHLWGGRG